ncbi:MAG: tetratricopeptide repeat protein [Alphaproteobacteria bacterium]
MHVKEIDPADVASLVDQGVRAINQRDPALAISIFGNVLEISPGNISALTGSATAQWSLGNMAESIDLLCQAHELKPESQQIRGDLRRALLILFETSQQSGDAKTALSAIRKLRALDPDHLPTQMNLELALTLGSEKATLSDYAPDLKESDLARTVLVACMPKSGSSWLLQSLCGATGFETGNLAHAYLENEQELYLPAVRALAKQNKIVQQHCRASTPNVHIIQAFDMRTVVLVRNLFDTLVSLRDFWDGGAVRTSFFYGDWNAFDDETKLETLTGHVAPWYVSFFASWKMAEAAGAVAPKWVSYENMMPSKTETLTSVIEHAGLLANPQRIDALVGELEEKRHTTRFNKGVSGRGDETFSDDQKERIRRLTGAFPSIDFSPIGL